MPILFRLNLIDNQNKEFFYRASPFRDRIYFQIIFANLPLHSGQQELQNPSKQQEKIMRRFQNCIRRILGKVNTSIDNNPADDTLDEPSMLFNHQY